MCYGLSLVCNKQFTSQNHTEFRYLDASGSLVNPTDLLELRMLVYLDLSSCALVGISTLSFPNLFTLDLSYNKLEMASGQIFSGVPQLRTLSLAGNPLRSLFEINSTLKLSSIVSLDLSNISMETLNGSLESVFPSLKMVNFSSNSITEVTTGFGQLRYLEIVDMANNPVLHFPRDMYSSQTHLRAVYADNYKLCCAAMLPEGFNVLDCHAPFDEVSSCEALLRSDVYRVLMSVCATLTLLGNLVSFVYRGFVERGRTRSYSVFVLHLCVSDFFMGVYLAVIGLADRVYQGTYLWSDVSWRTSSACSMAGVLSLLSSEVSAFTICLITIDRFLVLRFPFSTVHFGPRSAHVACAVAWCCGLLLAVVPVLPATSHWHFYQQSGICFPLPVTRGQFAGHHYSFGVIVLLNFALFVLIAGGQGSIYWSVRVNSMVDKDSSNKSKDLTIARRLISVAVSDFLCWFPIGAVGLMSAGQVAIPGQVNVAMAVLVLPLNSAINPFLYTLNIVLEKRRLAREQRLQDWLSRKVKANVSEMATDKMNVVFTPEEAHRMVGRWIAEGTVSPRTLHTVTNT